MQGLAHPEELRQVEGAWRLRDYRSVLTGVGETGVLTGVGETECVALCLDRCVKVRAQLGEVLQVEGAGRLRD